MTNTPKKKPPHLKYVFHSDSVKDGRTGLCFLDTITSEYVIFDISARDYDAWVNNPYRWHYGGTDPNHITHFVRRFPSLESLIIYLSHLS